MHHPLDTREEKIVLCPDCAGTGTRTVFDPQPHADQHPTSLWHGLTTGEILTTKEITCSTCAGHRVVRRVKIVTHLKVTE